MRLPRFTTLQLFLVTALAALVLAMFLSAYRIDSRHPERRPGLFVITSPPGHQLQVPEVMQRVVSFLAPQAASQIRRGVTWDVVYSAPVFFAALTFWAAAWGAATKRGRESLLKNRASVAVKTEPAPVELKLCWGLMVVGGLIALGIPIVLMFTIGPWLFPTIYFSLFVGLAAIARGASRDSVNLERTAALQLANMIAFDPANVVFAAMELALLRTQSVKDFLNAPNSTVQPRHPF